MSISDNDRRDAIGHKKEDGTPSPLVVLGLLCLCHPESVQIAVCVGSDELLAVAEREAGFGPAVVAEVVELYAP